MVARRLLIWAVVGRICFSRRKVNVEGSGQEEDRAGNSWRVCVEKMEKSSWRVVALLASNIAHLVAYMRWHGSIENA